MKISSWDFNDILKNPLIQWQVFSWCVNSWFFNGLQNISPLKIPGMWTYSWPMKKKKITTFHGILVTWESKLRAQWSQLVTRNFKLHFMVFLSCYCSLYRNVWVSNTFEEFSWNKEWSSFWGFDQSFKIQSM